MAELMPIILSTLSSGKGDFYALFNQVSMNQPITLHPGAGWDHAFDEPEFRLLKFPAAMLARSARAGRKVKTSDGKDVAIIVPVGDKLGLVAKTFQLKVIIRPHPNKGGNTAVLALFWQDQINAKPELKFPSEWKNAALLSLDFPEHSSRSFHLVNHENPFVTLLSEDERQSVYAYGFEYWKELLVVESPAKSALALLRATLFVCDDGDEIDSGWKDFVTENRDLVDEHWRNVAQALGTNPSDLEIQIRSGNREAILNSKDSTFRLSGYSDPSILPPVTDPNFLLYEVDENEAEDKDEPPASPPQ